MRTNCDGAQVNMQLGSREFLVQSNWVLSTGCRSEWHSSSSGRRQCRNMGGGGAPCDGRSRPPIPFLPLYPPLLQWR